MLVPSSVLMLLLAQAPAQGATPIDPPAGPGAMAPNLVVSGTAELLLTWLEPEKTAEGKPAAHQLRFSRLKEGAWSAPATIVRGEALVANWADFPSVARGADGGLVAHWAERSAASPYAYDVILGRSTDAGRSWRRIGPAHDDKTQTEHGFVSLLEDGAGVRAFWLDGRETAGAEGHDSHGAGAMTLRTAVLGKSLGNGELLDKRVCDCCGTAAAMTSEGPVVVYRNRDENEVRDIFILRRTRKGWSQPRPVHADGWRVPGCPVNGPSVAARGRQVAVAWYTYAEDRPRVRLAFSNDAGATFGAPLEVDGPTGGRAPLGRVDVALEEDGAALVSWLASQREEASLLVRRLTADGRKGQELLATKTGADRQSGFPRMERMGDALYFAWTVAGTPSQVRALRLPVTSVPQVSTSTATSQEQSPGVAALALGQPAPEYSAVTLDGAKVSLASERGHAVLVNLWATWCEPCRFELPELAALHERHAPKGLRVIGVSVDGQRSAAEVRDFVTRRKLPYTFWHDPADQASRVFRAETLPASFLFDKHGKLVWRTVSTVSAKDPELEAVIQRALKAP
jgi:thiol-disulfide isomerase/thioredoxin